MGGVDVLKALGLEGAKAVSYEEWGRLPEHRRHYLSGVGRDVRGVYLRLADPGPVAALRELQTWLETHSRHTDEAGCVCMVEMAALTIRTLAEFDGASS